MTLAKPSPSSGENVGGSEAGAGRAFPCRQARRPGRGTSRFLLTALQPADAARLWGDGRVVRAFEAVASGAAADGWIGSLGLRVSRWE